MIDRIGGGFKDYAPVVLRLALCTLFLAQGAYALTHLGQSPGPWKVVVAAIQILGAVFCLIGFLTRWAAAGLATLLIVGIVNGPQMNAFLRQEDQLMGATLFLAVALYCTGGGKWSIDLSKKTKEQK